MLLLRGATLLYVVNIDREKVSIHAPFARSNTAERPSRRAESVSIHAPLARSNKVAKLVYNHTPRFNTCSSCEEQPAGRA